ncbi:MAG: transglutaminaseTgpA domain-containing protein [Cyanobium sp.]
MGLNRLRSRLPLHLSAAAMLQWLAMLLLALALTGLQPTQLFGGLAIGLGVLTTLKLLEARRLAERRTVALLQLVCSGLVAAQRPELAASLLQLTASLLALAGLLALELGEGLGWRVLLRRSLQVLAAALPVALLLFLLVPRLAPFSTLPLQGGSAAVIGLSEDLDPGSIASLAALETPAARVAFPSGSPPPPEQRYWRVLVHDRFDGRSWRRSTPPLGSQLDRRDNRALPPTAGGADQLWLAAPGQLEAVPWDGSTQPISRDLLLDLRGELLHRGPRDQRRVYGLRQGPRPPIWQGRPPTAADLSLPDGRNPRLERLGRQWGQLADPEQKLQAARRWFRSQPFRYSLQPGTLPPQAPLDAFLFETRLGFCGHYASSFSALMRAAGVPARVVSGYRGGRWVVPLGGNGYLDLRQSDAHAWSEIWLPDRGWLAVDPTAWIGAVAAPAPSHWGPLDWLRQQWWGLDLAWTGWWLGFDRDRQAALLQHWLGPLLPWLGGIVLLALGLSLLVGLTLLRIVQQRGELDGNRRQLLRLLRQLGRLGLRPEPGDTLPGFAARVMAQRPDLTPELERFVALYQQQRYAPATCGRGSLRELSRQRRALERRLQRRPG